MHKTFKIFTLLLIGVEAYMTLAHRKANSLESKSPSLNSIHKITLTFLFLSLWRLNY